MFDHILTTLLQVVIALDIIGAIAYFTLGWIRRQKRQEEQPMVVELHSPQISFWQKLWPRSQPALANVQDVDKLRRILYGFQDGLH